MMTDRGKKVAIMQPYFLPYIGYFQLMAHVDVFVIYDNIEYTKKGWINRNRILVNGKDEYISLPLKKDSDFLFVNQRFLSDSFSVERYKLIRRIREIYRKAQHFIETFPLFEKIILFERNNLFEFIFNSLNEIRGHLGVSTELIISSRIPINHSLKGRDKVVAICRELSATDYVNPIGGMELYSKERFHENGIRLSFLKPKLSPYQQPAAEFLPGLSIIDVMMNSSKESILEMLGDYELV